MKQNQLFKIIIQATTVYLDKPNLQLCKIQINFKNSSYVFYFHIKY